MLYNEGNDNQNDSMVVYCKSGLYRNHELISLNKFDFLKQQVDFHGNSMVIHVLQLSVNSEPRRLIGEPNNKKKKYSLFLGDINIDIL